LNTRQAPHRPTAMPRNLSFSQGSRQWPRLVFLQIMVWLQGTSALAADMVNSGGAARHGESAITCSNPASGFSWQVRIDYDKSTVDSNPARISDTQISWHDVTDGGNYTLDRKSGNLTVIFASSTAGHFIYDRCGLED
jgi:hypothetical protein